MKFLITILLLIMVIIAFVLIKKIIANKNIKFLIGNSETLDNLSKINEKYKFYEVENDYNERYIYDNEIFFDSISCEDYLIYQLQFKKYDIEKEIKCIKYNKEKYKKYCSEISEIKNFGKLKNTDNKISEDYLLKLEKKLFNERLIIPDLNLNVIVELYCSKINGDIYCKKQQIFDENEIEQLIKRLENKKYGFYNDRDIWDSLCRVERGRVSNKMRFSIYQRDGYRCCICGRGESSDYLEIDHIKPIAKGGKSTYDNLQTLCRRCNKNKGDSF